MHPTRHNSLRCPLRQSEPAPRARTRGRGGCAETGRGTCSSSSCRRSSCSGFSTSTRCSQSSWRLFTDPQPGLQNFEWFFGQQVNLDVLWRTLFISFWVTVICVLFAFPYSYFLTIVTPRTRGLLMLIVLVPFWTSMVVRTFAWVILLQDSGPIGQFMKLFGVESLGLIRTPNAVLIGMAQVLLPFVVLPIYATMSKIDTRLLTAARSLGAKPSRAFVSIYLPLSLPGIASGALLCFVMALGFYITPAMLGSSRDAFLSTLIQGQVQGLAQWGHGAASGSCCWPSPSSSWRSLATSAGRPEARSKTWWGEAKHEQRGTAVHEGHARDHHRVHRGMAGRTDVHRVPALVLRRTKFQFPPRRWSTRWYESFFTNSQWTDALGNSAVIGTLVAIIATILGTVAALAINRSKSRIAGTVQTLMLTPLIIPPIIAGAGIYTFFLQTDLVGTIFGFVLVHVTLALPLVVIAVNASLSGYDRNLELAAASLGAGRLDNVLHGNGAADLAWDPRRRRLRVRDEFRRSNRRRSSW